MKNIIAVILALIVGFAGEQITSFLKTAYPDADVTIDLK